MIKNRILARQLRKGELSADQLPRDMAEWQKFLNRIEDSYEEADKDQYLVRRSMELSSNEMQDLHHEIYELAQRELQEERNQFKAIADGFPNGFCRLNLNSVVETANPAAIRVLGEQIIGQSLLPRLVPNIEERDKRYSVKSFQKLLNNKDTCRFPEAIIEGVDRIVPVSVLLYPVYQGDVVVGAAFVFEDISAIQTAELQRQRLQRAVESSTDSVFITDDKGIIQYVNPAFTEITGWARFEALGKSPSIMQSGLTPPAVHEELWMTVAAGQAWSGRIQNARRTEGGSQNYWVQLLVNPILDDRGNIQGYVAIQRDVSAEVERERTLERDHALSDLRLSIGQRLQFATDLQPRLEMALEDMLANPALPLGEWACICQKNLATGETSTLASSGGGLDTTKETCQQVFDLNPMAKLKIVAGDAPFAVIPLRAGRTLQGWLVVSCRLIRANARSIPQWLDDVLTSVASMLAVAIADDRAREEALQAREAALALARSKSDFLANMSHEIRTPMNGVLGMLDLLAETHLEKQQRDFLDIAYGSAESLLTIINDILDVSKIEAGKMHIEHVDFDVREVVEDVCSLFASPADAKGLELVCHVPANMKTQVKGDPTRLRQVLSNLIGNAVKFTHDGHVVTRIMQLPASPTSENGRVNLEIHVEDSGIGIAHDDSRTLFQPFSQADSTTTRKFGGTGLGLTISRQLAELMGGTLTMESRLGEGSIFSLKLSCELQSDARVAELDGTLVGLKVLFVDDNQASRAILEDFFGHWGAQYQSVSSGELALSALHEAHQAEQPFSLVISDMRMPDMSGLLLATRIKEQTELAPCKFILMCFSHTNANLAVDRVLRKPVRQANLYDAARQLSGDVLGTSLQGGVEISPPEESAVVSTELAGHVLLVEDNLINQTVAVHMLERIGLSVDIAENGAVALDKIEASDYDLVVMDCQMPVMDGYEATRQIRERGDQRAALPIVAMTANTMEGDREICLQAGMDDYIGKPVRLEVLMDTLKRWLPSGMVSAH